MTVIPYPKFDDPAEQRSYDLWSLRADESEEQLMSDPAFAAAFATWKGWDCVGDHAVFFLNYSDWADSQHPETDYETLTYSNYIYEQSIIRDTVGHVIYLSPELMYE